MTSLKEILESLSKEQRSFLMYAFEHEIPQYIVLPDSRYIGVNLGKIQHFEVQLEAGAWSAGKCTSLSVPRTL